MSIDPRDNPYKTTDAKRARDETLESTHAPARVLRAFLGMFLGAAAGMTGGGLTAAALGFIIAEIHGKSGPGSISMVGGLLGVIAGLPSGIFLGGGLALYLTREPPPSPRRFRRTAALAGGLIGLAFSALGVFLITMVEEINTGLPGTYALGIFIGIAGALGMSSLLAMFMRDLWK